MSLAITAAVVGIAAAGVGIAAQTGAFAPSAPSVTSTPNLVNSQEIAQLQGALTTEQASIAALNSQVASQKTMEQLSLGLGAVSIVLLLMHHSRK
jgi:hypothetical protein